MDGNASSAGPGGTIAPSARIMPGAFIDAGVTIHDDVRVGPNAVVLGSGGEPGAETVVQSGAVIGANATVLPGVVIGFSAVVGAGAVVTKSVPPYAIVAGNPAAIVRYQADFVTDTTAGGLPDAPESRLGRQVGDVLPLDVGGCTLRRLPHFADVRGALYPIEFSADLPFVPRRIFVVAAVSSDKIRGEHAHRECRQFLIAVKGSLSVMVDDGRNRREVELADPSIGLDLMPGVWAVQYKFTPETALLVLASHGYDADDYIRNYRDFRTLVEARHRESPAAI